MKLSDIAIFKRFIIDRTMRDIFIKKYREEYIDAKNPLSIEAYLSNVSVIDVINKAFKRFQMNSPFGFQFWQRLNLAWLDFYKKVSNDYGYQDKEKLRTLSGHFTVLRENWDSVREFWKYEPVNTALARYGLPPMADTLSEESPEAAASPELPADVPETDSDNNTDELTDPLADFDFFEPQDRQWTKLNRGDASINFRSGSFKITFNKYDSEDASSRNIACAKVSKSKSTGDICLVFAKEGMLQNASRVTYATNGRTGKNLTINSKDICVKLHTLLNLKQDYTVLCVEQLQSTPDYLIYKLSVK